MSANVPFPSCSRTPGDFPVEMIRWGDRGTLVFCSFASFAALRHSLHLSETRAPFLKRTLRTERGELYIYTAWHTAALGGGPGARARGQRRLRGSGRPQARARFHRLSLLSAPGITDVFLHTVTQSQGQQPNPVWGVVTAMPPTRLRVTLFTGFFSPVIENTGEMPLPTPERSPPGMSLSSKYCPCISTLIKFYCIFRFSLRWELLRT